MNHIRGSVVFYRQYKRKPDQRERESENAGNDRTRADTELDVYLPAFPM